MAILCYAPFDADVYAPLAFTTIRVRATPLPRAYAQRADDLRVMRRSLPRRRHAFTMPAFASSAALPRRRY